MPLLTWSLASFYWAFVQISTSGHSEGHSPVSTWLSGWSIGWGFALIITLHRLPFVVLNPNNCIWWPRSRAFLSGFSRSLDAGYKDLGELSLQPSNCFQDGVRTPYLAMKPWASSFPSPLLSPVTLDFIQSSVPTVSSLTHEMHGAPSSEPSPLHPAALPFIPSSVCLTKSRHLPRVCTPLHLA